MMSARRVTVIGDGGWGTALAMLLQANGHAVTVWGPFEENIELVRSTRENAVFLPNVPLPEGITWTTDRATAARDAEAAVLAVPTKYFRSVVESFAGCFPPHCVFVSVAKGLDAETHERMTQVAAAVLDSPRVAALSGPSHAEEVARGIPTAVTIASPDMELGLALQAIFANPRFRVYTSGDVVGTELGGALKNVIAIAVGISDGIGFGDNTRAALITRGLAEITRLGCALGAEPATFAGLSGMGDLIVTCTSRHSRNRAVGERLGKGETLADIMGHMQQVAEGVWNCATCAELAHVHGIEVPITEQVNAIVHESRNPHAAVESLLARDVRSE